MPSRPLLVVPGLFSSELYDDQLGFIWGRLRQLYVGPPLATLDGVRGRPLGILRGIPLVFGLTYDLLGALEGALVAGGGYRIGETLHYFVYDWRLRVLDLGVELAARDPASGRSRRQRHRRAGAVERRPRHSRRVRRRPLAARPAGRHVGRRARRRAGNPGLPERRLPVRAAGTASPARAVRGLPGRPGFDPAARRRAVLARGPGAGSLRRGDLAAVAAVRVPPPSRRPDLDARAGRPAGRRAQHSTRRWPAPRPRVS